MQHISAIYVDGNLSFFNIPVSANGLPPLEKPPSDNGELPAKVVVPSMLMTESKADMAPVKPRRSALKQ